MFNLNKKEMYIYLNNFSQFSDKFEKLKDANLVLFVEKKWKHKS